MDKKLLILSSLFVIVFLAFAAYLLTDGSIAQFTRADISTDVSPQSSLIFAWPLEQKADGISESVVSVFVRNQNGKGLSEKAVKVSSSIGTVKEGEQLTDSDGKATFHVLSREEGTADIQAFANNKRFSKNVTVKFSL